MAFNQDNMARKNIGIYNEYRYHSADAIAVVVADDYFLPMGTELKPGDVITAVNTAAPTVDVIVVDESDGTTTTVVNGT